MRFSEDFEKNDLGGGPVPIEMPLKAFEDLRQACLVEHDDVSLAHSCDV